MSFVNISKSSLLKTSTKNDVSRSGGVISVTGLNPIRVSTILDFKELVAKTEVVQVYTAGGGSYTPTASTTYTVLIGDPNADRQGYTGTVLPYAYTTPAVLTNIGASAALQREYIHLQIVAAINANSRNYVVAATLGSGTGFTITDDAGYYPANINGGNGGRLGASFVQLDTNPDGSGWGSAQLTLTTAAVYSFGQGTRMAQDQPVLAAYTQLLAQGSLDVLVAPVAADGTYATAGQKYNAFSISSLSRAAANSIVGQIAYMPLSQVVFVDNGTGAATTNLTGFIAFARNMRRIFMEALYIGDTSSYVDYFDQIGVFSGSATPAPVGTNAATNNMWSGKEFYTYFVNGTATILAPYATTTGLPLSLDATDDEGMELSAPVATNSPKEFVVGVSQFSIFARINLDDISGTDAFYIGLRKKEAYAAVPDNYNDMATLALTANAGLINMATILTNAATVVTSTGVTWADTETHELEVRVLIDGTAKFFVDGVDKSALQATPYVFTAGLTVIPFISFLNTADIATPLLQELLVVPSATWRL